MRHKLNWTKTQRRYGQMVSAKNRKIKVDWCLSALSRKETFQDVIFVDETCVELQSSGRMVFYQKGTRLECPSLKVAKPKHPYKVSMVTGHLGPLQNRPMKEFMKDWEFTGPNLVKWLKQVREKPWSKFILPSKYILWSRYKNCIQIERFFTGIHSEYNCKILSIVFSILMKIKLECKAIWIFCRCVFEGITFLCNHVFSQFLRFL